MIPRQPAAREDVAEAILDAADRLIQHYGYSKTTVDDIAREAHIGKGTIYLHFRSKEDVALSCIERLHHRLQERMRGMARCKGSASERVRKLLLTRVLFRFDEFSGYAQSHDEVYASLKPRLMGFREKNHEAEAEILAEVLVEGRVDGEFDVPEALPAARTLILATSGLLPYSLTPQQLGQRHTVVENTERLVGMLLTGLLSRHNGTAREDAAAGQAGSDGTGAAE